MSHPRKVETGHGKPGKKPRQQQVEGRGLEEEGARRYADDLRPADAPDEGHGAGQHGYAMQHLGQSGHGPSHRERALARVSLEGGTASLWLLASIVFL